MSDHEPKATERAMKRRRDGDRRVARAALHQHGPYAAARLRVQAGAWREETRARLARGRDADAPAQTAARLDRAAGLIERGEVA